MKKALFKFWDRFPYPLVLSKYSSKLNRHKIESFNKAFLEVFKFPEGIPLKKSLEEIFGDYFKELGMYSLSYREKTYYLVNLPYSLRQTLHVFIEERAWLRFPHWFHTERLASLGKLAGEISHELNNPLGGILLYSNMLKEELGPSHPLQGIIDKIIALTTRCKIISKALLDFGKPERGKKEWINLNDVIMTIYNLVADYQIFKNVNFIFNLDPKLPLFYANPTQMEQVILNIYTNATEAMKGLGEIRTETKVRDDRIIIRIADSGPGIPPEILPFIFDPFFTTKQTGKGTGLGLSICHSIIKRHGGIIKVENLSKGGAAFEIILPLATREALREDVF
ncbi:MAG: ATP-binding protein [Caldimicrobium sp.]|nr:ATP-binding protein [Caldimicrobium sp.]MCX7872923.1 ATP-binding protein [Caldimicrobium sp.]MDW8094476.1 ATP-binding protein [Caldimicrobium sp.]